MVTLGLVGLFIKLYPKYWICSCCFYSDHFTGFFLLFQLLLTRENTKDGGGRKQYLIFCIIWHRLLTQYPLQIMDPAVGWLPVILTFLTLSAIQFVFGQIIEPRILGKVIRIEQQKES